MAYSDQFGSGINLEALMVPTQSATVYAAQESSLYLPGSIIPIQQVAQGSATAQVAVMGTATVQTVAGDGGTPQLEDMDPGVDFTAYLPSNTKTTIALDLIASRTVIRDLGGACMSQYPQVWPVVTAYKSGCCGEVSELRAALASAKSCKRTDSFSVAWLSWQTKQSLIKIPCSS
mgnify:CR=1 FL=1